MSWDDRWMGLARHISEWSYDETKVGAVIVGDRQNQLSLGWNGFPRKVNDIPVRRVRPIKYLFSEHAERNAIYNASASGTALLGATLYCTMFPCADCARGIIQAGIQKVVTQEPSFGNPQWGESFKVSLEMLKEAKVTIEYYEGVNDTRTQDTQSTS